MQKSKRHKVYRLQKLKTLKFKYKNFLPNTKTTVWISKRD